MSELVKVIEAAATVSESEVNITPNVSAGGISEGATVSQSNVNQDVAVDATLTIQVALPSGTVDNKVLVSANQKTGWANLSDLITAYFKDNNIDYILTLNERSN